MLISCSSQKQDIGVINNYVNFALATTNYDTLFVAEQPISKSSVLSYYYKIKSSENKAGKITYTNPSNFTDWPIEDEAINTMMEENDNNSSNWETKDFDVKVIIVKQESIKTKEFITKHINPRNYILYISKPIYNEQKDRAFFQFDTTKVGVGKGPFEHGIIIMKKENGKWIKEALLSEDIYY